MKLVVSGATGSLGSEIIRQALQLPDINSIVVLSRRPLVVESHDHFDKLKTIILDNFEDYSPEVRQELSDADACIWSLAITPTKSKGQDFAHVSRVCYDYTFAGLDAMLSKRAPGAAPLRFMYISGLMIDRSIAEISQLPPVFPPELAPYGVMRCRVERDLASRAEQDPSRLQLCCARPGLIATDNKDPQNPVIRAWIGVADLARVLLRQVADGFTADPLSHDELMRLKEE